MRVFALGGAGHVGRSVASSLAGCGEVSEIKIAGRSLEGAKATALEVGEKASAVELDATDHRLLTKLAKGYDLIVNTAGPDYLMQYPAVLAAINAGVHYCDIAADGPTTERVLELSDRAKDAGVTAVIGIGSYPGLSNLMMMHAASRLDAVDEVHLHSLWSIMMLSDGSPEEVANEMRKSGRVSASWQTVMRWFTSPGRVFRDGRLVITDPLEERQKVPLSDGSVVTAFLLSTTEPITLPRSLHSVKGVSVSMTLAPMPLNDLMHQVGREVNSGKIDLSEAVIRFVEAIRDAPGRWLAQS